MNDIDTRARALYDACPTPKPAWAQLGETTKDVWRERVTPFPCRVGAGCEAEGVCLRPERCGWRKP